MKKEKENFSKINQEYQERLHIVEEKLKSICNKEDDVTLLRQSKKEKQELPLDSCQVFLENMDEAAIIVSKENHILYANQSFFEMVGLSSESVINTSILDFICEADKSYFTECLLPKKNKKSELQLHTKSLGVRTVIVSVFKGIWQRGEELCLLLTDITQLKRAQYFTETSELITKAISEAASLSIASKSIINLLNQRLGWEAFIVWLWNEEKHLLNCIEIAHIDELEIDAFKKQTNELEAEARRLFSHVYLSNRPIWIRDVTNASDFLRRDAAIKIGLRGALAFPFNKESQLGGVIELFRRTPFEDNIDSFMLDLITSISIQIGVYIERQFSEQNKKETAKALELSLNIIYTTDKYGNITSWRSGAEKVYGWKQEDILGQSIKRLYPNERTDDFDRTLKAILSGISIDHFQSQRVKKDGKLIWVTNVYDAIHDCFGQISGVIVVEQDITAQTEFDQILMESKQRYHSFIELTGEWIWDLDKSWNFYFSNQRVYSLLGYEIDEILNKNLLYFLPLEDRERVANQIRDFSLKKEGWRQMLIPFLHKNGTYRWFESNAVELLSPSGELLGFRGVSRDVTESKNLEKVRDEFISIMSHELRTPLTSICGALTLLTSKKMSFEDSQKLILIAEKNSIRLSKLINDTMDIEKLQLGKLKFDLKKINLRDVILESISSADIIGNKFNVKIVTIDPLSVAEVNGDYWRLVQVMNNLLSNAIKFSPSGGTIFVGLEIQEKIARVSIRDSGKGIPKEFQPKIFQIFSQADSSLKRSSGGTGLGLYISKSIIHAHGGTIDYLTTPEKGTIFFFDIPLCISIGTESKSPKASRE